MSYRERCHVDSCDTRFIGISRAEYVEHLREEHDEFTAVLWDRVVVNDA